MKGLLRVESGEWRAGEGKEKQIPRSRHRPSRTRIDRGRTQANRAGLDELLTGAAGGRYDDRYDDGGQIG